MSKNYTVGSMEPTAFITVRKQRQKQNGKNLYLHNSTEFEIELYNPTTDSILAKININNKPISDSGIVLKPGQRVFLERYLDIDRKFLFETYNVSDTETNRIAIEDNGLVTINFFKKKVGDPFTGYVTLGSNLYLNNTGGFYTGTSFYNGGGSLSLTSGNGLTLINSSNTSNTTIETGRVEIGDKSNQEFDTSYEFFEPYSSWTREWKILPFSQKDKTAKDLIRKCSKCDTKLKDTFKFCPQCGSQIYRTKTEIHYTMGYNVTVNGKVYSMSTYNQTLDGFLERNKNKLIYIKSDSLTENSLKAIVID
jgi:predicted RNA-binding Zn-ribbon protein involved in translation (DUF1610 family)